jgi:dGTPase
LRVIDELEERYAAFNGLNLCFETREGVLKHCSLTHARLLGDVGQRFIDRTQPSLEAQLANLADEIAYNNHDIDDGLRSGLLTIEQLQTVPIFARHYAAMTQKWPGLNERRLVAETIRSMINTLITDVTQTTQSNLLAAAPVNADAARRCGPLVAFSPALRAEADALKKFLFENLYRHYKVMRMTNKARRIVRELFDAFVHEPRLLPPDYRHEEAAAQARAIADYIAGMTDRYAIREHHRLFRMGNQFD